MAQAPRTLRGAFGLLAALVALVAAAPASAAVSVNHVSATGTEAPGNGDQILSPGEAFALTERISNAGGSTLHHVHGSLEYTGGGITVQSVNPFVTLTQSESDYANLAPGTPGN